MNIQFYEKPGCINNTKQKVLLEEQGHSLTTHSILTQKWTKETLRPFFNNMLVAEWFNKAAPQIKSGDVNPAIFNEETAIIAMIANPILIRRPLIEAEGELACGFDNSLVNKLLNHVDVSHLQSCPKTTSDKNCDEK